MTCKDTGVYIELSELAAFAKAAASDTEIYGAVNASIITKEVYNDLRRLRGTVQKLNSRYNETGIPKGSEWLLDNFYIVDREGQSAAGDLRGFKRLPKDRKTGEARIVNAACAFVESGRGEVSEERLSVFLDSYQNVRILSEAELCAFIPSVKAALVSLIKASCDVLDNAVVMENAFTSLRFLSGFVSVELLENVNRVEAVLRTDPAGVYARMDEETRQRYRKQVSMLAKRVKLTEYDTAKLAVKYSIENNTHVGWYLFKKPLDGDRIRNTGIGYMASILLVTLTISVLLGIALGNILVTFLLFLPVWDAVKNIIDFAAVRKVPPDRIHRLALENGIPASGKTLCVISVLLTSKESAENAVRMLEEFSITNADAGTNLNFGLLADLKEADEAEGDEDRELIEFARAEVEKLNSKYAGGFYLFTRKRTWCESAGSFMGWERKRGAITELICMLKGDESNIQTEPNDLARLEGTAYIITLDSDTRLTAGAAIQLVGAAMHPLNRPVINEKGVVTDGYGILQPRVSVELKSANRSDFTRIFAGQGGIDPYSGNVSDIYQDMFSCGSFTGKGLIDINAYYHCLNNRLPNDTILSHDLIEGAYLGCGFIGDTEFVDSCPEKVTSYYQRLHRWVRGDWQNCIFISKKFPLSPLNKWKILDNLRRSLTPVFTLAALLTGMLSKWSVFGWMAVAAVLSAMSNLLISSAALLFRRNGVLRVKYLSGLVTGAGGLFMQTLIRIMLLPYEAWICFSAIVTALFRLFISKRNLLQWTTAAESEKSASTGILAFYRKMLACPVVGVLILFVSPYASACAVGIIWILTPFYAWALSKRTDRKTEISENDRRFLISCSGDIWRYFEEFITPFDNFLPPDNWQEQPANGAAHRTSPTNIGLTLLSALAAVDLGLTDRHKALGIIENVLTTVERLPKWNGHLYNWYDTRTLKILEPAYVSTVDSGNLAGDLIALREGLIEFGENALAERANKLYQEMSFIPLYDSKRRLFYIGWDAVKNSPTPGYYDLLASEARQTSYIGVAKGDVPRKHWRQLSRALVSQDGYLGLVSWTGTMFEYLMPHLLLPCRRDSLLYESAKFCVYVQKNHKTAPVWGMSESAYYSFDPALNYQYKAHGIQRLALKRGMGMDNVISPYSSFLALMVDFKGAIANLKAVKQLGAEGRFGFYEALDFTPTRVGTGSFKPVRNFMVHHLGMSLLSVDNVLNEGIMQKRFMRDINMASYSELLQEKIPAGAVVLKKKPRDIPEKPPRNRDGWSQKPDKPDLRNPGCCLLSNGEYSVLVNTLGHTRSMWGDIQVTRFAPQQDTGWRGVEILVKAQEETIPLYYTDDITIDYGAEFSGARAVITARTPKLAASMTVRVPENERGELREIQLSRTDSEPAEGEITVKISPVLTKTADFASHPLFSKLSLEAWTLEKAIMIKRRSRGEKGEMYMCIAFSKPASFAAEGYSPRNHGGVMKKHSTEMNVTAKVKFALKGEETAVIKFAIGTGKTAEEAKDAAYRILFAEEMTYSRIDRMAFELGLSSKDIEQAMGYISHLVYITTDRRQMSRAIMESNTGIEGLWRYGISGDIPILLSEIKDETQLEQAKKLIRQYVLLTECGLQFDLVLVIEQSGDYRKPVMEAVRSELMKYGKEYRLGSFGGVHLADDYTVIEAMANKIVDLTR
ncbi:MAG: hypothetical protein E7456_00455 [Ruminococcaceae bacterium]|nr:hypothetical protein [Oscillospiraceae bacterium]